MVSRLDYISVVDFEVYAYHGVLDEEKEKGQLFLISFDVYFDLSKAGKTDDIDYSVSYAEMCYKVEAYMIETKYNLIEKLAEGIAHHLMMSFSKIDCVKISIKKPFAPVGKPLKYAAVTIKRGWHEAYIAIGSNMGNRRETIESAIEIINQSMETHVTLTSTIIETEPFGYEKQNRFMNGVFRVSTLLSPADLMTYLLEVEKQFGRKRDVKWGPRTLDLDILFYDEIISDDAHIILPHPRMEERLFVLEPLSEIAPYKVHPILKCRVLELKNRLEKK